MCGTKSCAILGHSPMRFAWGFDEEAVECHGMKMELAQQIMVLRQQGGDALFRGLRLRRWTICRRDH